jgi:hypothetical protein
MKFIAALFSVVALASANMNVKLFTDGNCQQALPLRYAIVNMSTYALLNRNTAMFRASHAHRRRFLILLPSLGFACSQHSCYLCSVSDLSEPNMCATIGAPYIVVQETNTAYKVGNKDELD